MSSIQTRQPVSWTKGFLPVTCQFALKHFANFRTVAFSVFIPVLMYLIFGTNAQYADISVGHGNVSAIILVNMAQYGASLSAASLTARIAIDYRRGIPRTVALTPLGVRAWMATHLIIALLTAMLVTGIIFAVGASLKAEMESVVWLLAFALTTISTIVPALMGLVVAVLVGGEEAYGILGGGMAVLGFLSGMFIPLDQLSPFMQKLAEFTPLWSINQLVLLPLVGWEHLEWKPVIALVVWLMLFITVLIRGARRMTKR